MDSHYVMLVVSVPVEHVSRVRDAIADAGGGTIGAYSRCSFSYVGVGRFVPGQDAHPAYGKKGEPAEISEERIETICDRSKIAGIVAALKAAHPYEEPAYHYFDVGV